MIRKFLPLVFILFCIFSVSISSISCVAASENSINLLDMQPSGVDLGAYDVKLSYKNYTLYSSGAYRAIEIVFDNNFVSENYPIAEGAEEAPDILSEFAPLIKSLGYIVTIDKENNTIIGERSFDDLTELYIAMGMDGYDSNSNNYITQKSFFFTDTFIKQPSPFTDIETTEGAFKNILNAFYALGVKREAVLLNYTYGTPYTIIKSDADQITYSAAKNIYLHSYDMNLDMSAKKINLVQHSPNSVGWYTLAIMISLVVISVPVSIFIIKHKKKNKETGYGVQ